MAQQSDILLLGATGYTGRLITRYLASHPQRSTFTLALGARSRTKLQQLVKELNLNDSIALVEVDVTKPEQVERAVKSTKVVINTVGPYWRWGTPVVRACAVNGVHYVDLTGETAWIKKVILEYDYLATKTGAIIVPSCGFDSMPSDISAYLGNKTLKAHNPSLNAASSITAQDFKGGISGGTISTFMMVFSGEIPSEKAKEQAIEHSLSPVVGVKSPKPRLLYTLPIPGARPLIGGFFVMQPANKRVVQRTYGLLELDAQTEKNPTSPSSDHLEKYGPNFYYDEFMVMHSKAKAVLVGLFIAVGFGLMIFVPPLRWLVNKFLPQSGEGPSDEDMAKGYFLSTNITTSASSPSVQVKSTIKGKGDPGYLLTAIMISEAALALGVDGKDKLTKFAKRGGLLTPVTAFGDRLLERLEETGRFEFSSFVVEEKEKDL